MWMPLTTYSVWLMAPSNIISSYTWYRFGIIHNLHQTHVWHTFWYTFWRSFGTGRVPGLLHIAIPQELLTLSR